MSSEQRSQSIYGLNNLLMDVIKNPSKWIGDTDLIGSLKAQGKLCRWSSVDLGIISCSLNTLKTAADSFLDEGFTGLDLKRCNALLAIEREISRKSKPKSGSKLLLKGRIKEQASQIRLLEQRNIILTYFVGEVQALAIKYSKQDSSETHQAKCRRELQLMHSKLSFTGECNSIVKQPSHDQ